MEISEAQSINVALFMLSIETNGLKITLNANHFI